MTPDPSERGGAPPLVRVTIPAVPEAGHRARSVVAPVLAHLSAVRRADLLVVLSELVACMVDPVETGRLTIDVRFRDRALVIEVEGSRPGDPDPLVVGLLDRLTRGWSLDEGVARFEMEVGRPIAGMDPDEVELFTGVEAGDPMARDVLFERYRGFAIALTRRFRRAGIASEDLEQVASIGLVKALDRFDPSRGVKFTTFAARTIEGELKRHLRDRGWSIRVPRGLQDTGFEVRRAEAALTQRLGRPPSLEEVAEEIDLGVEEVGDAVLARLSFDHASLDAPPGEGEEGLAPLDRLPDPDRGLELAPEWADLLEALRSLSDRDRRILQLRFFEDLSQSEIAERVGVSQMHVSRLLARALATLRAHMDPG